MFKVGDRVKITLKMDFNFDYFGTIIDINRDLCFVIMDRDQDFFDVGETIAYYTYHKDHLLLVTDD